ncbi:MAG: ABC transporter substrate-binding protein [Lachnospiraceae bacterium]|nr:ABC transporter substrate-binding protein [Lachnospiraceae bacterium]
MNSLKKVLAVALCAMMVLALTACGNKDKGEITIKLTRATFNCVPDSGQVKKVEDAINKYLKDKGKNYKVEITEIASDEYVDKAKLKLTNKEINLLWTASWESGIGTNDLVPANSVKDITKLLEGTTLYNSMDKGQWEATKYNGKNYFIPVYKDNVEGYDLMFRDAALGSFDVKSVKTLADLEPLLKAAKDAGLSHPFLTQKTPMFYRFYIDKFDFFTADSASNWVSVKRDTNEVVCTIDQPEYAEYCKLMGKWAEAGYINESEATKTTDENMTKSQNWAVSWWTDVPVNAEASSRYEQPVTLQAYTNRWAHSTSALGSCYCITANTNEETAKACIDFMGLLYTDSKLADIYTFGIEGEDFKYDGNKVAKIKDAKYNHSMWESASATVVTPESGEPDNKADLYKTFNGTAQTSCAAGFRFDMTKVQAQYTACKAVFDEYGFVLENGGVKEANVDAQIAAYKKALKEAGLDDVIAEFTAQYNAFKK